MGNVSRAAKRAGVGVDTAYEHRKTDTDFARGWQLSLRKAGDVLEAEAWRRAVKGVTKPVFQQGGQVGDVQEYSDTLLIFLLKGVRPKKFRDNVKVEHGGKIKTENRTNVDLSGLSDDELLKFERAFAGRAGGISPPGRN